MIRSKLEIKWQKEIDKRMLDHEKVLGIDYGWRDGIRLISDFIKDIKNLNGETVKREQVCPVCLNTGFRKIDGFAKLFDCPICDGKPD